jgi:hypothetical protein
MVTPRLVITPTAGLTDLARNVAQAEKLLGSPAPILKAFGVVGLREVDLNFRAQGRPRWEPLKPSTTAAARGPRGKRGPQALSGFRGTFDSSISGRTVAIFSRDPRTLFHEKGTKGPYEIRAKNAKALALPFLPGRDGGKGTSGSGKAGKRSLAGLGRARRSGTGFVLPGGSRKVGTTNVAFYAKVTHPGLPARPMLPTTDQIVPRLKAAAIAIVTAALKRR